MPCTDGPRKEELLIPSPFSQPGNWGSPPGIPNRSPPSHPRPLWGVCCSSPRAQPLPDWDGGVSVPLAERRLGPCPPTVLSLLISLRSAPTSRGPGLGAAIAPASSFPGFGSVPCRPAAGIGPRPCLATDQSHGVCHDCGQSERGALAIHCGSRPRGCSIPVPVVQAGRGRRAWARVPGREDPSFPPWGGEPGSLGPPGEASTLNPGRLPILA